MIAAFAAAALAAGCGGEPPRHLERGIERLRDGAFEEAATLLELAADHDPEDASVLCNLGLAYWKLGQTERAVAVLKNAAGLAVGDERPLEFLGQIYIARKQLEEARRAFERAAERAPLSARVVTSQAVVAYHAGRNQRARDLLEQAVELNPDYAPAVYNMGVLHRDRLGNERIASVCFTRYLQIAPDGPRRATANAYVEKVGVVRPRVRFQPRRSDTPAQPDAEAPAPADEAQALLDQGAAAIAREDLETALIVLKQAVRRHPDSADALWMLARLYDRRLRYAESAAETYAAFQDRFPEDPRVARIPAPSPVAAPPPDSDAQPPANAEPAADAAPPPTAPSDSEIAARAFDEGLALHREGKTAAARAAFQKALTARPDMIKVRYMFALSCRETGDDETARQHLRELLDLDPFFAKAHLLIGLIYRDLDDERQARHHLQLYVGLAPRSPSAPRIREWLERGGQ